MLLEKAEKAYNEIFEAIKKYGDLTVFNIAELERQSKCHLCGIELKEKYGFDIDPKTITSFEWVRLNNNFTVGLWGEKYRRTVSWSDDGTQPEDERLLVISFPTGAYIFGDDYPEDLFKKFFLELKSFNPKYTDSHNHGLYYSMDNAGKVFNNFKNIMNKYNELNREDYKQRRIKKMKDELKKLEGTLCPPLKE